MSYPARVEGLVNIKLTFFFWFTNHKLQLTDCTSRVNCEDTYEISLRLCKKWCWELLHQPIYIYIYIWVWYIHIRRIAHTHTHTHTHIYIYIYILGPSVVEEVVLSICSGLPMHTDIVCMLSEEYSGSIVFSNW